MKILLLSCVNSIHTKRWAISLAQRNIEICLFSLEKNNDTEYGNFSNITVITGGFRNNSSKDGEMSKLTLIQYLPKLEFLESILPIFDYVLIEDVTEHSRLSFWTHQTYYDTVIPRKIFAKNELSRKLI